MTAALTDVLSRTTLTRPCCRRAEMITVLRFAGGLHHQDGQLRIEVDLPTLAVARRVGATIRDLYGYPTQLHVLPTPGSPAATEGYFKGQLRMPWGRTGKKHDVDDALRGNGALAIVVAAGSNRSPTVALSSTCSSVITPRLDQLTRPKLCRRLQSSFSLVSRVVGLLLVG